MKRLSLLITMFVLAISQLSAQDNSNTGTITLSHKGKETNFAYNKMGDAVEAATDGDTIYLSNGEFEGDFRLTKKIAFIGSGAESNNGTGTYTHYNSGNIVVTMPEGTKLSARLFDGIYFDNSITFQTTVENVIFRKCRTNIWNMSVNKNIESLYFDRCEISGSPSGSIKKVVARNCKIDNLSMSGSEYNEVATNWQFIHCTIYPNRYEWTDDNGNRHCYYPLQGIYTNCIIENYNDTGVCELYDTRNSEAMTAAFINCLLYKPEEGKDIFNGATIQNNMFYDVSNINANWENQIVNLTKNKLQEMKFLGNDGTVVGCYGGKNPYTLKPNIPIVSSSKVHLDRTKKQIQINIKLSSQQ